MRIVTWNMQGGTNTMYINQVVQATGANVLCLQECGLLAQHLANAQPILDAHGAIIGYTGNLRVGLGFMECVFWENAWTQGGVAVLSNVGYTNCGILPPVLGGDGFVPNNPRSLPWMTVTSPTDNTVVTIFSVHSPPVSVFGGTTLANVCNWNNANLANIAALVGGGPPWICLGDFNADPTVFGFIPPPVGTIVRGNHATQLGGGLLDYAVANVGGHALPVFVGQGNLVGASDHYPQAFDY